MIFFLYCLFKGGSLIWHQFLIVLSYSHDFCHFHFTVLTHLVHIAGISHAEEILCDERRWAAECLKIVLRVMKMFADENIVPWCITLVYGVWLASFARYFRSAAGWSGCCMNMNWLNKLRLFLPAPVICIQWHTCVCEPYVKYSNALQYSHWWLSVELTDACFKSHLKKFT